MQSIDVQTRVLYIWFMAIAAIVFCAFAWFMFDAFVGQIGVTMSYLYPSQSNNTSITISSTIWQYVPVGILFVVLTWVFVTAQKQKKRELMGL